MGLAKLRRRERSQSSQMWRFAIVGAFIVLPS